MNMEYGWLMIIDEYTNMTNDIEWICLTYEDKWICMNNDNE